MSRNPTAAMLVIGDEILSGRTKEKNAGHLAELLDRIGIDLREIRIVADDHEAIVAAIRQLRGIVDHLFTSGGIGPTHDDITAEAVADALERTLIEDPRAVTLLGDYYEQRKLEFTAARRRMTRMPEGSDLIDNPVSTAPGFTCENVHVLAGIPSVFNAMLDRLLPTLGGGTPLKVRSIASRRGEGDIGDALSKIAAEHDDLSIGSYPRWTEHGMRNEIVLRGQNDDTLDAAERAVRELLEDNDV